MCFCESGQRWRRRDDTTLSFGCTLWGHWRCHLQYHFLAVALGHLDEEEDMNDHEKLAEACEKVGIGAYGDETCAGCGVAKRRPCLGSCTENRYVKHRFRLPKLLAKLEGELRKRGWWLTLSGFPDEGDGDDMPGGFGMTWTLNEKRFCVWGGWCETEREARTKAAIEAAEKCEEKK